MARLGTRRPVAERPKRRRTSTARSEPPQDGQLLIERQAHDGRGVARNAEGKTLFVERALPGERVIVAVHAEHRRYDEAHVRELLALVPERVTPACTHFGQCGGCDLQHQALDAQRAHRRAVLTEQFAHHDLILPEIELIGDDARQSAGYGYRRRARLGVRVDSDGALYFGFRRRSQDNLFNITQCPILTPRLEALLKPLRHQLEQLEAPRRVGHVELLELDGQCCLSIRQLREVPGDIERWRAFADEHQLALVMGIGREQPVWHRLDDGPPLQQTVNVAGNGPVTLELAPGDFLQANAAVNQQLVNTVLEWSEVGPGEQVLDLFAGVGNFTLPLAALGARVTALEGRAAMVDRLQHNAARNGLARQITARVADLAEYASLAVAEPDRADLVVLDPPRSGARTLARQLAMAQPARVVYISCDPATLARDVRILVEGGYRIERAAVADMFPQTSHQESVLLLRRVDER
ncbi:23S rRNA m(5)U-1939 methyltransferase [Kushneria sinocarnis]|uniref:23S rRNA m(5)U-1939 methyltransferase n=1 Tax=Kushneria sinocarnis TaxID=595502 RepID=A0A420WYQ8_9GAMM|nr:methyltransferase domain-containing protein [Kushneria sinocarnis]RKR06313.1 23S rRNA m(5)U-1939 methyltransferase [Kushneria sinocarnis]